MFVKKTKQGTEFIFDNKFSKKRVPKNDRRLNSFLKLKFNIIRFLRLNNLAKKLSWYRTLEYHWGRRYRKPNSFEKEKLSECIRLTQKDLYLKQLIIYDLFPKEYLDEYRKKYLKFKNRHESSSIFNGNQIRLDESFSTMESACSIGTWYNLDHFNIRDKSSLSVYFDYFSVEFIGLTDSFYVVKYNLDVNDSANKILDQILKSKIYKDAICISKGAWWKKGSIAGARCFDLGQEAKTYVIEDFILELKSIFWEEINKHLLTFFFTCNNIQPSIEIYSSKTLAKKSDDILTILACDKISLEYNENEMLYFSPFKSDKHFNKRLNNSKIIADAKQFETDGHGMFPFFYTDEIICQRFADYFLLDGLNRQITELVYKSQRKINKCIVNRGKYHLLLNTKLEVDKKLFFYYHLYSELTSISNSEESIDSHFKVYKSNFTNIFSQEHPQYNNGHAFVGYYKAVFYDIKRNYEKMRTIYTHFDDNLKVIESRYNYRIVKWTFIVALLTLLATVVLSGNPSILDQIYDLFIQH